MKIALAAIIAASLLVGCASRPERNPELESMSRGPALAVPHVKKHCHRDAVWREFGMTLTYDNGQRQPAVGIMCLSPQDTLVMLLCDKTGTFCNVLPYERTIQILKKEEELRRMEGRVIDGRRL